jgi:hypothetical protein
LDLSTDPVKDSHPRQVRVCTGGLAGVIACGAHFYTID